MTTVIHLPSRHAAATTPAKGSPDPLQSYGDAHNALAMALRYLRQPGPANVPGATRKTVQALAALRSLSGANVCTSASTTGRV